MTPVTGEPVPPPAHQPPTNMVARLAGRLVTALRGSVHTIIARIDKVGQQAANRWSRIDESISEKMSRTITPQRPTPSETEPLPLPQEPIPHEVLKGFFDGIIRTPLTFLHGGKQYTATLEGQTIQIQDTEDQSQLLRLTVDKGKIVTITTATSSPTEIPPAWKPVVDEFVGTFYERSSSYLRDQGGNVEIQVFREGVRSRAPSHVKNFLDTISLASDALPKPIGDALNSFLTSYDLSAITQTVKRESRIIKVSF